MVSQQYCLKWKHHNTNIQSTFSVLREKACYCDVTIWCDGAAMRAHRAVLAACSDLFAELLAAHDLSLGDPAIVLTDAVHAQNLRHLLAFMYTGEVRVHHGELAGLLKTAEELRIKGLADVSWSEPAASSESSCGISAEAGSRPQSPAESRALSITSKSEDESCKITDDNLSAIVLHETLTDGENLSPRSVVVPKTPVNGSIVLPIITPEPEKKRRGRPTMDNSISDPPKRPKMMSTPNILRKSKTIEHRNENVIDISSEWPTTSKNPDNEDALSEYSEASLDGRDISQFLDTTMEEEPAENSSKHTEKQMFQTYFPNESGGTVSGVEVTANSVCDNPLFADVVKLPDYLVSGRRTQFWAEDYVKRVMEAVFCRELEMKQAAEILGVSYGTLYGRYRDTFGCINRPYRAREFWAENTDVLAKLIRKEISFSRAAELLNISPQMLFSYVSAFESAITQKELFEITQDKNSSLTNIKNRINAKAKLEIEATNDDDNVIDVEKEVSESYNRLSDILRKHHDMQEAKANEFKSDSQPIIIDSPPELSPVLIEPNPSPEKKPDVSNKDVVQNVPEEPGSSTTPVVPKKLPMIRVANLKFLKGELPGPANINDLGDKMNTPLVLRRSSSFIRPDLKMMSSKRKVTFQEIELSLKQANINVTKKSPTVTVKPPASVT
ncbi:uncharacterized protein LOC143914024 [Arctopsyche grandis]|uniref:uncharacterized protein LOC143914024 n=1 Tax=Arctopsyche grandis TaxID=121162 RepID=UPI00406D77A1